MVLVTLSIHILFLVLITKVASYNTVATEISNDEQVGQSVTAHYYAHASSTQPAGTYTGAVKYTMVHPGVGTPAYTDRTIADIVYLQDFDTLSNIELASVKDSMVEEQTYTKKDKRDNQDYTIAKLKDGKVWMTKNLNLAGGTALTSDKTDFDSSYTIPETQGWQVGGTLPASSTNGFLYNNYAYVYNSNSEVCASSSPCYSYYSWDVATLGSGRNISTEGDYAPYSICPKGWSLPTSGIPSNNGWKLGDLYALATAYGANLENNYYDDSAASGGNFAVNAGPGTASNLLFTGDYYDSLYSNGGSKGYYWSNTSGNNGRTAQMLYYSSSFIYSSGGLDHERGAAIRCIAR